MNDDEQCHDSIYEIPNGLFELVEMLGHRFLWQDRRKDEFLSWTSSLLFALVHATGRRAKGQRHIVIHVIDTRKATTIDRRPVEFYFAPDLLRILKVSDWRGWTGLFEQVNLRQPWYTHEWLTHGVVKSPATSSYEANIEEVLDAGLYDFLAPLHPAEEDDIRSLYHRCVNVRSRYHDFSTTIVPLTADELTQAEQLASCFINTASTSAGATQPLQIVLDFLGIKARNVEDEEYKRWIASKYTGRHDVLPIARKVLTIS